MAVIRLFDTSRNEPTGWADFDPVANEVVPGSKVFFEDHPGVVDTSYTTVYGVTGNTTHLVALSRVGSTGLGGVVMSSQGWTTYLNSSEVATKLSGFSGTPWEFKCTEDYLLLTLGRTLHVYSMPDLNFIKTIDCSVGINGVTLNAPQVSADGSLVAFFDYTYNTGSTNKDAIIVADIPNGTAVGEVAFRDFGAPIFLDIGGVERLVVIHRANFSLFSPVIYTTGLSILSTSGEASRISAASLLHKGFAVGSYVSGGPTGNSIDYYGTYQTPRLYVEPSTPYGSTGDIYIDRARGRYFYAVASGGQVRLSGFPLQEAPSVDTPMFALPAGEDVLVSSFDAAPGLVFTPGLPPVTPPFWSAFNKTREVIE